MLTAPYVPPLVSSYSPTGETPRYPFGFRCVTPSSGAFHVWPDVCCTRGRCRPTLAEDKGLEPSSGCPRRFSGPLCCHCTNLPYVIRMLFPRRVVFCLSLLVSHRICSLLNESGGIRFGIFFLSRLHNTAQPFSMCRHTLGVRPI